MHPPLVIPTPGNPANSATSRLLLAGARVLPEPLGSGSCFRKFVRRNRGKAYQVETKRGFSFAGTIGDSVDNRIAIDRDYEPPLSDFIARHAAGSTAFLDIGCNVGWFSCLVAALPDRPRHILSVDANPLMVESCRRNLDLNGFTAETLLSAVGPEPGVVTLHVPERRHSRASLGRMNAEHYGASCTVEVPMCTLASLLDRFPGGRCDLIKMDIEGYELETLRHVPADVIARVGMIVLEYARENLEGCGFNGMTLGVLPWLDQFSVKTFDEDGRIAALDDPAHSSPDQTTFILTNRSWQD